MNRALDLGLLAAHTAPPVELTPHPMPEPLAPLAPHWRIMVVDRDPEVQANVAAALRNQSLLGRPVEVLQFTSCHEARERLRRADDIALVLLEAATTGDSAGLELVAFIRHTASLHNTRIVLRTMPADPAPALSTLQRYDIHDYRTKSELGTDRLLSMVITAIRSYEKLCAIETNRRRLELIVRSNASLLKETSLQAFASGVITQLAALLNVPADGVVCAEGVGDTPQHRVIAAAGRYAGQADRQLLALPYPEVQQLLTQALESGRNVYEHADGLALHMGNKMDRSMAVYIDLPDMHNAPDQQLLEVFSVTLSTLLHNRGLLKRLRDYAYYDPLVGLPNRAHFVERVDDCVRQGTRDYILALVDIDDFSAANDVMGHRFGDRLLEMVGQRLAEALPAGVLLARVGADTFGVLGPSRQVQPQRLLECARQPLLIDDVPHKVSLTCGYVLLSGDVQAGADLVKDANIALKRAKREHRGQYLQYSEHMGAEARARALLLSDLRAAIEHGCLFLVYQPQIDLISEELVGLEALVRWRTEDGQLIPPDQFIPVAEHSGLIVALGQWVLESACATMRELLDAGIAPHRMAVNVSMVQLQDTGYLESVRTALARHGLQGHHLELEITESVAVLPTALLESTLSTMRADGISIAIDDFGTGYSSLSYLERLPLDRIKIDRAFVRQLGQAQGARIAEMVTQLGRKLGLRVLAEGIEDAATWQALKSIGCHEGQGFHIARPMDQQDICVWLRQRDESLHNADSLQAEGV